MTSAEYLDLRDRMARLEAKLDRALANWPDVPDGPPTEPGTPEPPSNPDAPSIDTASVTWLSRGNPLDFPVGSQILDVTIEKKKDDGSTPYSDDNYTVCFPHTMAGKWPALTNAEGLKYQRQRLRLRTRRRQVVWRGGRVAEGGSDVQAADESPREGLVGHRPAHEEGTAAIVGSSVR